MAWTNVDLNFRVTRQTITRLELKCTSSVMQVLGLFLVGAGLSGAWNAGFTQLTCQRLNTATVSCTALEARLLGLIPQRSVSLSPLKDIFVEQQIALDDDGEPYPLYRLSVDGDNGAEFIFIQPTRHQAHVEAIATQLTQFTQNPESQTLTLKEREWLPILALLFLLPVGLMLLLNPVAVCSMDRDQGTLRIRRYSPLRGTLRYDTTHPLKDVAGVAVEQWQGDEDTGYRVSLVLREQRHQPLLETYSPNESPKQKTAEQIRAFLNLPPVIMSNNKPARPLSEPRDPVLSGKMGTFWAIALEHLSIAQQQSLSTTARQLDTLGFEPLGSMVFSRFSNIVTHGFVHSNGTAYALVMHGIERSDMIIDFYTMFSNGASLTTSTTAGVGSMSARKLYRNAYPGSTPHELWRRHRQALAEMSSREGSPQRSDPELRALALAIDEFFTRYPSSPLHTLKVYATQLWYVLMSPNPVGSR